MFPYFNVMNRLVPAYGVCVVLGILVASAFVFFRCRASGLCFENALIIGVTGIGIGLACAKILYLFVSFSLSEIIVFIKSGDFSVIANGGFVFYGGFIGGVIGALIGAKIAGVKIVDYENSLCMAIPIAHFFGRIGCFCAGCCYGKPCSAEIGVIYTNPIGYAPTGVPLLPVQLYEAVYNLIIFVILFLIDKNTKRKLLPYYLMLYAAGRFVLEFFRYDCVRGMYFGLSTSQLISVALIFVSIILFVFRKK